MSESQDVSSVLKVVFVGDGREEWVKFRGDSHYTEIDENNRLIVYSVGRKVVGCWAVGVWKYFLVKQE